MYYKNISQKYIVTFLKKEVVRKLQHLFSDGLAHGN